MAPNVRCAAVRGPPAGAGGPVAPTADAKQAKFKRAAFARGRSRRARVHAAAASEYCEGSRATPIVTRRMPGWRLCKYLVEDLHADVNARDIDCYTPLHHAAAPAATPI